jgi:hypothetical protein
MPKKAKTTVSAPQVSQVRETAVAVQNREIPFAMKSNIIKASLQRSINYFMEVRGSVDTASDDYAKLGKKISAYIAVKQTV